MVMGTKKSIFVYILLVMVMMIACHRNEMPAISVGDCFIATLHDKQVVVRIDGFCHDNVLGNVFQTDSLFSEPQPFTFTIGKNGKSGILEVSEISKPVKIKWKSHQNQLICRSKSDELPRKIVLERCQAVDTFLFHRQLCDSLYDVKVTTDVEYARADGYWTSYPDEDKSFADIYTQRMADMAEMQEQPLLMDIYEPVEDSTMATSRTRPT